jgi:predicted ATPase
LLATVAQAAGLPGAASHDALAAALGRRRTLLVLDGCEHLIDGAAALALRLLRTADAPHLLVTSREPLRIDGERVVRLPPLPVPLDETPTPAALSGYAAVQLFVERASADGGFTLDDGNAAAVAAICRRLDGIPLALELAAGRAAFFGVHELARRLSDCFAVLTRGRRTALPRHQTLRATLDWSHDLLTPAEQAVLRRLAALRGAFTLDDAVRAAQGRGIAAHDVPGHVAQLVAKSMVAAEPDGGAPYRLLDTTRSYALEKLRAAGEG